MSFNNLDIHSAVQTAFFLTILFIIISAWAGIRAIRKGRTLKFFRMRRERMVAGWRLLALAFIMIIVAFVLNTIAEPVIYSFFPPTATLTLTPTVTLTPTITQTPTITLSPTITPTPSVSDTPTITPTPLVPLAIEAQFQSTTTPSPDTIFSPLVFAQSLDENFQPVDSAEIFQNPVGHLYAWFTYDQMIVGSQWTAIWYYGTQIVHYETQPWNGGTGGIGFTDWEPQPFEWLAGEYEVQIFVGLQWKQAGRFTIEGEPPPPPPTNTPSATTSPTATDTPTYTVTPTPTVTLTRTSTQTRTPTSTRMPTNPPLPTDTRQPSQTPTPRPPYASPTPTITRTRAPTFTPAPPTAAYTHAPTFTPAPPTPTYTHMPTNTPRP